MIRLNQLGGFRGKRGDKARASEVRELRGGKAELGMSLVAI